MTFEIILTLSIIGLAIYLFVSERFSIDTVAIMIMVIFMVTGILTPEEGFAGFNNSATITVGSMFVLSAAIFKTGLLNRVSGILVVAGKQNFYWCLLLIMAISGVLSAFINDTAVVAMLMPVVIKVAKDTNISPGKLLMPLSFGSLLGGVCTLVGTSTNILVSGIASNHGLEPFGMFELSKAGIFFLIAGILYMLTIGHRLIPDRKGSENIEDEYDIEKYIAEIRILPDSGFIGKPLQESSILNELEISILQVLRDGQSIFPYPSLVLQENDIVRLSCEIEDLKKLVDKEHFEIVKSGGEALDQTGKNDELTLVEVLINPDSRYSGRTLKELKMRQILQEGVVLAIRSRNSIVHKKLKNVPLKTGDILLLRVSKHQMGNIKQNRNFLVISEEVSFKTKPIVALLTLGIVGSAIALAALNILPIVLSASLSVLVLIVFRFISPEEAYDAIQWKVIFMLGGVLSMGLALEKTGAALLLGEQITALAGDYGPKFITSLFFFITFMATNVMSNNASAALLAPIAIVTAETMGVSARPLLMAVTFAASLSFMTPMGYQTNTMIYGPGNYRFSDYLKVGTPLNILLWLIASLIIPWLFEF
jgi:di/tricarboxylate transporter